MKKILSLIIAFTMLVGQTTKVFAVNETSKKDSAAQIDSANEEVTTDSAVAKVEDKKVETKGHAMLKEKFIEGDPLWMALPLICLILGLAIAIERVISLYMATINTQKFVAKIDDLIKNSTIDAAKEECRNTPGPIASIYYQGLDKVSEGSAEIVEKSVVAYGSVQAGQLEKGLIWISLFIALAPMLGFLGTVVGMIFAFDDIQAAGDISPTVVAGGIKVALLTTVLGLIAAIILQIFYNFIVSKVDSIINDMENSSIDLLDILVKHNKVK